MKNQLSQYLQYVKHGERVLITEHNRVIAEITLPGSGVSDHEIETELEKLAVAGKLIKAKRNQSISISTETPIEVDWISVYQENRSD